MITGQLPVDITQKESRPYRIGGGFSMPDGCGDAEMRMKAGCGNYKHCPALTVMLYEAGHSTYEICGEFGIPSGSIDKLKKKGLLNIRRHPKSCKPIIVATYRLTDLGELLIAKQFGISTATVHRALINAGVDTSKPKKRNGYGVPNGGRKRYSRAKNYKQRCLKYGVKYDERVTLAGVYERDSGVCQLCGRATDWNDNRYVFSGPTHPTIDHIIPLSRGGSHTWGNVQLACHECNSKKGNEVAN